LLVLKRMTAGMAVVAEGLNYYPNSVVQRASSRNAAWLLD
jgi:hypothetical protein